MADAAVSEKPIPGRQIEYPVSVTFLDFYKKEAFEN